MLDKVMESLNRNEIVCFPTETVYALACSAYSEEALFKLCKIKRRDTSKPLSLLCKDLTQVAELAKLDDANLKVLEMLTPGPVTFVLPICNTQNLPRSFFGNTLGIRIPDHEIANAVLQAVSYPLVATSANISGIAEAAKAVDVPEEIRQHVSALWNDDSSVGGVCSTVFDLTTKKVIRAGVFPDREIFDAIRAAH